MTNPYTIFADWFLQAKTHPDILEPTAMALATATQTAMPSVRIVLLKSFDERGFVFYTNLESRKSEELKANPNAALCFHWKVLLKQIRIEGRVERVNDAEANAYFNGRPLISRLGAIASKQSRPLPRREDFLERVAELESQYSAVNPPPRPDFWSGWRVVPRVIEFWQEGEYRLHDRDVYTRAGEGWTVEKLYP